MEVRPSRRALMRYRRGDTLQLPIQPSQVITGTGVTHHEVQT